jgi:hypothetical protein
VCASSFAPTTYHDYSWIMHAGSPPQDSSSIVHINALYSLLSHTICPAVLTLLSIPSFPSFLGCVLQTLLVRVRLTWDVPVVHTRGCSEATTSTSTRSMPTLSKLDLRVRFMVRGCVPSLDDVG